MKRFFTTLIASSMVLAASAQSINFDDYESDPEQGTVPDLSMVCVLFPNVNEIDINSAESIFIMKDYDEIEGSTVDVFGGNMVRVTLPELITDPGEYILMIGEGALCGYSEDYSEMLDNPSEIYLTFNIEGGSQSELNFDFTADPDEGTVTELSGVTLTFTNIADLEFNSEKGIGMTRNGGAVEGVSMDINDSEQLVISFAEPLTEAGEYKITIDAEALCGFDANYNYLDNPDPIVLTYTIEGEAETLDFSFTASPENGSTVAELSYISMTFPGLDHADTLHENIVITVGDETLATDRYTVELSDGNMFVIAINETLTAEQAVPVRILFAAGTISGSKGGQDATNANPIELNYQLAPAAVADLTLVFNTPTKPNSDGEISADRQLDAFFFMVEGIKDLNVASGTEHNVTILFNNEAEDWEKSARLQKAYGLNANNSYFSAPFNSQPVYNGDYIITIAAEAIGDEMWLGNNEFGHTNEETILHFTLVDGITAGVETVEAIDENAAEIYTLQGIRVNGKVTELPAGFYVVNGKVVVKK